MEDNSGEPRVKNKTSDGRNIIDYYFYWNHEAIKADLDKKRLPFSILVSNLFNDFNIASVLRGCNAFTAKEFFYYGRRKFDKRGTTGAHHYEKIIHLPEESNLDELHKSGKYNWVAIDNIPGAVAIDEYIWPENTLMCFGQETVGTPPEILNRCKDTVYIRQLGATRSLNVACAASIAMYDFTSKFHKKESKG